MSLTHDWRVAHDAAHDFTQIHGGLDDQGIPEYVLTVTLAPGEDWRAAADLIAAALRGEA